MADIGRFTRTFSELLWKAKEVLAVLLALVFLGGLALWCVEDFGFWESMYLALITATTIGYGNLLPTTAFGKVVSILLGVIGMILMGIVIAASIDSIRKAA